MPPLEAENSRKGLPVEQPMSSAVLPQLGRIAGITAPLASESVGVLSEFRNLCFISHPGFRRIGYQHTLSQFHGKTGDQVGDLAEFDRTAHHYEEFFTNWMDISAIVRIPVMLSVACDDAQLDQHTGALNYTPAGGPHSCYARFLNQQIATVLEKCQVFEPNILLIPTALTSSDIVSPSHAKSPEEFRLIRQHQRQSREAVRSAVAGKGLYVLGGAMEECLSGAIETFLCGANIRPVLNGCYSDRPEPTPSRRIENAPPDLFSLDLSFPPFNSGRRGPATYSAELELLKSMKESERVLMASRTGTSSN